MSGSSNRDARPAARASSATEARPPERPPARPIPPSLELAWGLREEGTRGPRRGLTLERIVDAGIELAATGGVGALSMAKIAKRLGVGTMSLYRYVAAKDELLTLMVDSGLGTPPPLPKRGGWRAGLTAWCDGMRAAYRRHPWALKVPIAAPPLGPNNVAWLNRALESLAGTRLSEQDKLSSVLLLSGFVRNEATLTADFAAAFGEEQVMPGYGTLLLQITSAGEFPALHRAIASGALDDEDDMDLEYRFGMARILDGIGELIDGA
jgi:AcrR family transcriptional regulator